tara:strand:- start:1312 stop:1476 length:165 start_codon:yes stop_codon:yes gene_type:complete
MLCCYGFAKTISKETQKKRPTVKPFCNIKNITVYENKRKVKTVIPGKPLETIVY